MWRDEQAAGVSAYIHFGHHDASNEGKGMAISALIAPAPSVMRSVVGPSAGGQNWQCGAAGSHRR